MRDFTLDEVMEVLKRWDVGALREAFGEPVEIQPKGENKQIGKDGTVFLPDYAEVYRFAHFQVSVWYDGRSIHSYVLAPTDPVGVEMFEQRERRRESEAGSGGRAVSRRREGPRRWKPVGIRPGRIGGMLGKAVLAVIRGGLRVWPGRRVYVEFGDRGQGGAGNVACVVGKLRPPAVGDLECLAREVAIENAAVFAVRMNGRWRWGYWNIPTGQRQRVRNVLAMYVR